MTPPDTPVQFSLQAMQALLWLAVLAVVAWGGLRVSWGKLVGFTAFLTLDLIMFGAFVRLSDSGLGCPDWPGCYGKLSPFQAGSDIAAAVAAQGGEHGWVSNTKAWIEMIHRYWATFIGVLIVVMVVRAFKTQPRRLAWPLLLLVVVVMQGMFGKLTVTLKLMPVIVTTHLLGGMLLWALLVMFAFRQGIFATKIVAIKPYGEATSAYLILNKMAWLSLAVLFVQIALGGWTSSNYAALACADFPLCQGKWLPAVDFANGFDVTRGMGKMDGGGNITLAALAAVHWVHRSFAYVVLAVLGALAWKMHQTAAFGRTPLYLALALGAQVFIGIATVVFNQPLLLAVAHNGGAAVLLGVLLLAHYKIGLLRRDPSHFPSAAAIGKA